MICEARVGTNKEFWSISSVCCYNSIEQIRVTCGSKFTYSLINAISPPKSFNLVVKIMTVSHGCEEREANRSVEL